MQSVNMGSVANLWTYTWISGTHKLSQLVPWILFETVLLLKTVIEHHYQIFKEVYTTSNNINSHNSCRLSILTDILYENSVFLCMLTSFTSCVLNINLLKPQCKTGTYFYIFRNGKGFQLSRVQWDVAQFQESSRKSIISQPLEVCCIRDNTDNLTLLKSDPMLS